VSKDISRRFPFLPAITTYQFFPSEAQNTVGGAETSLFGIDDKIPDPHNQ
jgi:hypothetical protein